MNNASTQYLTFLNLTAAAPPRPQNYRLCLAHHVRFCCQQVELSVPEAAA